MLANKKGLVGLGRIVPGRNRKFDLTTGFHKMSHAVCFLALKVVGD